MGHENSLEPCTCRREQVRGMIELIDSIMREDGDQSVLTDYPLVYRDGNLENVFVIEAGGAVVSVVPFIPRPVEVAGCRFSVGIISPTGTAVQQRKQGLALKGLQACIAKMERDGVDLSVLWTMVPTFAFYAHGEYQGVRGQHWTYECGRGDAELFADYGQRVVQYDAAGGEHIDAIQRLHETEAYGVRRAADEYPGLFRLPKMKTLLALEGEQVAGYLVVSDAINKPGLVEAGGASGAVETLVRRALLELAEDAAETVHENLIPTTLGRVLEAKLPQRREPVTSGPMMVRINDPLGFMRKISPWLAQQGGGEERAFSVRLIDREQNLSFAWGGGGFSLGKDRLEPEYAMTLREFTSVVFGAHAEQPVVVPERMQRIFPFYFPIWMLDHS